MMIDNILLNSAVVIFSFYIIACIARLAIKTYFSVSSLRNLESAAIDLLKNHLPNLLKARGSSTQPSWENTSCDMDDCSEFPCCSGCTCPFKDQPSSETPKISVLESPKDQGN